MVAGVDTLRQIIVETGALRAIESQVTDLVASARRFREAVTSLPQAAWDAAVRGRGGQKLTARDLPWVRLREVEIHHVDLDAGYTPRQWPAGFLDRLLPEVAGAAAKARSRAACASP